jgi:glycosyltransferase involved in cell wall biosynthesis
MTKCPLPLVSIVMPVKNEGLYIAEAINGIDAQDYPRDKIEIIIVDGGSSDTTAEIIRERMTKDVRIKFIPGPYNCPAAMNAGIGEADGSFIAKVDGHGYINKQFLTIAISYLMSHPEYSCIGGEIIPLGDDSVSLSNMYARFSKFGVGSGIYTAEKKIHSIDTVQCGVYIRKSLEDVGCFDPTLQFGEDDELNFRLTKAGYKIVYHPDMKYYYYVRRSFGALYRQYRNYGEARVKVLRKHPDFLRLKHIVPSAMVLSLLLGLILLLVFDFLLIPAVAPYALYFLFVTAGAFVTGLKNSFYRFHYLVVSLMMLHFGYGIGMIKEFLNFDKKLA